MNKPLVYLACPYSSPDREILIERFHKVNKAASRLMLNGCIIFSPISHTHPIAEEADLPKGWEFWSGFDRAYLSVCNTLYVLMLEGWEESTGVQAELKIAEEYNIPVVYLEEEEWC